MCAGQSPMWRRSGRGRLLKAASPKCLSGLVLEIRVMVPAILLQLLGGHAEPAGGLPHVGAALHQVGRSAGRPRRSLS
jgi:hypothetical protein